MGETVLEQKRHYGIAFILLSVLLCAASSPAASARFASPKGKFEAVFAELEHRRFKKSGKKHLEDTDRVTYRIEVFKKGEDKPAASVVFNDVYGWDEDSAPTPVEQLFNMIIWSPEEDFLVLPYEGWASAPGTDVLKACALNPGLAWKEADFAFNNFFFTDDLTVVGDRHDDCDLSVLLFDGKTGSTLPVKASRSPVGYELISVDGQAAFIREVTDNCRIEEKAQACFTMDLVTKKETPAACPPPDK